MKFKVFSKIRFFFLIYSVMIFSACHDSDKIEPEYGERTVLIYMAADNNLNKDGETNIKSILKGMEQTAGRLVIYIDRRYDVPRLLTVKGGKGCRLDTLETYTEENSASPEVLARVVKEVQKRYPASSYGLVLWSHGLGWVPPEYSFPGGYAMRLPDPDMPRTKYYAEDEILCRRRTSRNNGEGLYGYPGDGCPLARTFQFYPLGCMFYGRYRGGLRIEK